MDACLDHRFRLRYFHIVNFQFTADDLINLGNNLTVVILAGYKNQIENSHGLATTIYLRMGAIMLQNKTWNRQRIAETTTHCTSCGHSILSPLEPALFLGWMECSCENVLLVVFRFFLGHLPLLKCLKLTYKSPMFSTFEHTCKS